MKTIETVLAIIGGLVVVGTLIDLVARGGKGLGALYRSTFGRRRTAYDSLAKLTTGVQIDYFNQILGAPSLKNTRETHDELVFVARDFYVQAIATKEGRVDLYAVTARNQRFRPAIWGQTVYWST
ncbi:MAG: ETEC_3214 domain-containing protein, partial [bacterium]